MARLSYKLQKIFADVAATGKLAQFGSLKAEDPTYSDDPDIIQALTYFGTGLNSALTNQAPPAIQEIDALFNIMTKRISYLQQTGIAEWDANTVYYKGSLAQENGIIFRSLTDDNQDNALSDTVNWILYENGKTVVVTDYSHEVAYDEEFIRVVNASPTGHVEIRFPYSETTTGLQYIGRKITVMSEIPSAAPYYVKVYNGDNLSNFEGVDYLYRSKTFIADSSYNNRWTVISENRAS
jgi:hypothetical protein